MKRINSLSELKEERKRLLQKQIELELAIKEDLKELKEEIDPSHLISQAARKLIMSKDEDLVGYSVNTLVNFIISKMIFRKSGFITKFAANYIARNFTTKILSNKATIFNWIVSKFQKITKVKSSNISEKKIANTGYQ